MIQKAAFLFSIVLLCATAHAQLSQIEKQLVEQLNASRVEAGLSSVKVDDHLTKAAREHSKRMADKQVLAHVLPGEPELGERLAAAGLRFNRSAENVGYNSDFHGLHDVWMHSPPHRKNILTPEYTLVGIGVVRDSEGVYWATQDFARPIVQLSGDEATDIVVKSVQAFRKKTKASPMQHVDVPALEQLASKMGKTGKLDPKQVLSLPNVRSAVTYNNSQLGQLPPEVQDTLREKYVNKFAVGVCQAADKDNPGGTYYVLMAFY